MDWYSMSDRAIIKELGKRIKQMRLKKNISQAYLAEKTGIHRVTVSKIENSGQASLLSIVQLLRGLDELNLLDNMMPYESLSPLQLAGLKGKKRKRASKRTGNTNKFESEW